MRFVLSGIVLGGLSFTNTWDYPVYGTIFVGALMLGRWLRREPIVPALAYGMGVLALGYLLYLPWAVTFSSQARGIGVNLFNGTRFPQLFVMFAPFLAAGAGFTWLVARSARAPAVRVVARTAGLTAAVAAAGMILTILFGLLSSETRALAQELNATGSALGVTRAQVEQRLLARASDPWTILVLGGGAALCAVLLLSLRREGGAGPDVPVADGPARPIALTDAYALLLFGAGALLTLAVEFVFLRDLFGTRMNTVFKFYYQAWTVWSVAGAYAITRLLASRQRGPKVVGIVALACVALGLLWPLMAVPARAEGFVREPTLDGEAYLAKDNPDDAAMIAWLNANVPGDAHIIEAPTLGAYQYDGRISAFTGLPAALGWGGHQHQWRGSIDEAARRQALLERLYLTTDPVEARSLLGQFEVAYVIIGAVERARFPAPGLEKFESLCSTAFQVGASAIYHCGPSTVAD
jgi:YYY domain-containing protein